MGCNYWASHAGTHMWRDWRPDVVDADLAQLAEEGLQVLRVFPLWPDFQPITQLYTGGGRPKEIRHGESPLPATNAGRAGVSQDAMDKFAIFAEMADKHGLKLVVGLVTGWMSGRWFVPPALEGRNVLTDPVAIMWQVRFVRHFVRTFKDAPALLAWDLGNECNCMGSVPSREAAWTWTASIANTVRSEDASRPIVSGMHSLKADPTEPWSMVDQGELTDVLTTHPYPIFTAHCDQDPVNTIRNGLHASGESRLYSDIGGRPCIAEEVGTLGPMVSSESVAADYVRMALFSLWAHDCHGLFWWCAYDQDHLENAPYDWNAHERELGLIRSDQSPKPVIRQIGAFRRVVESMPFDSLPPRLSRVVCILTEGQDHWGVAHSAFILGQQAGVSVSFQHASQPLRDADVYLLPSLAGGHSFPRRFGFELMERVRSGATLYLSHESCMLSPFEELTGVRVITRERRAGNMTIECEAPSHLSFETACPFRLALETAGAEVLAREPDGNPAFTKYVLGDGAVYFLTAPIERNLANTPSAFSDDQPAFWRIYEQVAASVLERHVARKDNPLVGLTEHAPGDDERIVVLVNYTPKDAQTRLTLAPGWRIADAPYGAISETGTVALTPNDGAVIRLTR